MVTHGMMSMLMVWGALWDPPQPLYLLLGFCCFSRAGLLCFWATP